MHLAFGLSLSSLLLSISSWALLAGMLIMPWPLLAQTHSVNNAVELTAALQQAQKGEHIHLQAGQYQGQFQVLRPLTLTADKLAIIDAQGKGSAISVRSADVTLQGLSIRNWGNDLYQQHAGVHLSDQANNVQVIDCHFNGQGFGIFAVDVAAPQLSNNVIVGDRDRFTLDRGDGIHLLRVNDPKVTGNRISWVRDGVYLESGTGSVVDNNQFESQQYAIHYMYTQTDRASGNVAHDVDGGYALMNATGIVLEYNQVTAAREFGVLLNLTNDARIAFNHISDTFDPNSTGELLDEGKGIFIYGARGNELQANLMQNNQVGLSMAMGGESNRIFENQFIDNQVQVKYIGDVRVEWSHQGRGNYWSDYQGWDLNGNGIGETLHLPNDSLDRLFWLYPEARFLSESPVVKLLKWLDNQIQQYAPKGVTDSYPLLAPAPIPRLAKVAREN
ncbi:nitrous oxide reductase family maturation protein NosD [Shewanella waksmanii]|uniref:nitrous oxide reductase family maturation protein NosD n=1 Tax=Shewanella waksmanii TaxID=213783 RepID=UPI003736993A